MNPLFDLDIRDNPVGREGGGMRDRKPDELYGL